MPAKLDGNVATLRDLQIFKAHTLEGKTLDKTAKELGISRDTIKRTKRKPVYRDMVLAALEAKGFTVDDYVAKLIDLAHAKKSINIGGLAEEVDDNVTQMKAIEKIGNVYGDNAPREINIAGDLASASDAELLAEITELSGQPGVVSQPGEQGSVEGSGDEGEGTVLPIPTIL
ncbi:MAG: hypothetical protein LLF76_02805 [Planctomycetaceae bacterium]|nr:hypothetical protein [Planctomycetaceae bacterium]